MRRSASITALLLTLLLVGCKHSAPTTDSPQDDPPDNQTRLIIGTPQKIVTALNDAIDGNFIVYSRNLNPEQGRILFTGRGFAVFRGDVHVTILLKHATGTDATGNPIDGYEVDITSRGAGLNASLFPRYAVKNINEIFLEHLAEYDLTQVNVPNSTVTATAGLPPGGEASGGTGSGFAVDSSGHIVTNAHVVDKAKNIFVVVDGKKVQAYLVKIDTVNDLALLKVDATVNEFLKIRKGNDLRAGEEVVVAGYPLRRMLASEINITTGTVSALVGLHDDTKLFQITAPIQPGNSGGPVFDRYGCVCGVVVSSADAIGMAKSTGRLPQNVNFAINLFFLKAFLEVNNIGYGSSPPKAPRLEAADVADIARKATFLIIAER